jgi:hypothetical protein
VGSSSSSRSGFDVGVARWAAQGVHGHLQRAIELPRSGGVDLILELALLLEQRGHGVVVERLRKLLAHRLEAPEKRPQLRDALLDIAQYVLGRIELRLLGEVAHTNPRRGLRVADEVAVDARHDPQQAALSGAVRPEYTDLGAGQKRQRDVLENHAVGRNHLAQVLHRVDELLSQWRILTEIDGGERLVYRPRHRGPLLQ